MHVFSKNLSVSVSFGYCDSSIFVMYTVCVWCLLDSLLCRSCGHDVANADHIVKIPSLLAKQARNDTILGVPGVLIQLFENPQGTFQ